MSEERLPEDVEEALGEVDVASFNYGYAQAESEEDPVNKPLPDKAIVAANGALSNLRSLLLSMRARDRAEARESGLEKAAMIVDERARKLSGGWLKDIDEMKSIAAEIRALAAKETKL